MNRAVGDVLRLVLRTQPRSFGGGVSHGVFFAVKFGQLFLDETPAIVYIHNMADKLDLSTMENCVCFNLRRASRVVTQFFDAEMRRQGIRPTQSPLLAALAAKSDWKMEELSDWLGMERTTLVRNLRPLERDGLVEISGAGRGSRVTLAITAKGKTELARIMPAWRAAQRGVIKTLGEQRWSAILSDLQHTARTLTQ